jgi:RNA-directed DNA polymerase
MRLPHTLVDRLTLVASSPDDVCTALGDAIKTEEETEIHRLCDAQLPPITSLAALSVMTGYNPGFVWLLANRTDRFYRVFEIPKGRSVRQIEAPRVALKLIQKWISVHLSSQWRTLDEVHGFVRGRSHLTAASAHLGAKWILSVDLENFFPSISAEKIRESLQAVGYRDGEGLEILVKLLSFKGRLCQGAPSSPVISNIAFATVDSALCDMAEKHSVRFTRYADDITFSGQDTRCNPESLLDELLHIIKETPWKISERKIHIAKHPTRLKVHGLLVHRENLALTKGYRNKIRAYKHLLRKGRIADGDRKRVTGHLNYAAQVDETARVSKLPE